MGVSTLQAIQIQFLKPFTGPPLQALSHTAMSGQGSVHSG